VHFYETQKHEEGEREVKVGGSSKGNVIFWVKTEKLSCFESSQTVSVHPAGGGTFEKGYSFRK
jgi:hypothetical protein